MKHDLPRYIFAPKGKAGKRFYYYRRAGRRLPICDKAGQRIGPDHPQFMAAYLAIHQSFEAPQPDNRIKPGTLDHLVIEFRESPDFRQLAAKTQGDYARYLDLLRERWGDLQPRTMTREFVIALRDAYADKPRAANYLIAVLRRLMSFAMDRPSTYGVTVNPAARPRSLKTGDGHSPWEEAEIAVYRAYWSAETWERVVFEVLLATGQRGGDVAKMARGHYHAGAVAVTQQKTGVRVWIPASKELAAVLDPWLSGHKHLSLFPTSSGAAYGIDAWRHKVAAAIKVAGIEGRTIHGLRYTAATRLREIGLDWEEVAAITGHQTADMARKYSRQKRTAELAVVRLDAALAGNGKRKPNGKV